MVPVTLNFSINISNPDAQIQGRITDRERARGGALLLFKVEEEIQDRPCDLSVSLRFQSHRACTPMKPHVGKNLLWDPP